MPQTGNNTHFGFQQVALGDKQARVDDVFHSVARRYDLMNDLMSGGLHRAWKGVLVTAVNPPKARDSSVSPAISGAQPFALLDLAGGTGDVAFRAIEAGGADLHATVVDINADMLDVGRARADERGLDDAITFVEGNAEALPFPDRSFDAVVCCVSVDYLVRPIEVFRDVSRALRPGGVFVCTFSNRCFPTKAIRGWLLSTDAQHGEIVAEYFRRAGGWDEPVVERRTSLSHLGDPLYAVWARRPTLAG